MNLIKCFKKRYAIQNLKKSKGILAILLLVLPIVTLFSVYVQDQSRYADPYNIFVAAGANFFGMIIIPFLLSNVLFGYIFKKNNIDFIHSMPINRKNIFITNTLVGLGYILVLQILNFLVTSIYILIVGNSLISVKLMFDIGLVMSLIYIFLFSVSNLAISVSGNIFTQIVVALLLLFILPFVRLVNFGSIIDGVEQVFIVNYNGSTVDCNIDNDTLFAMPIATFFDFVSESRVLELKSAILTIGLTVLYIMFGLGLFEKRKMENTGNSFESEKMHLFVKGITLYPAIVVLKELIDEIELPYLLLTIFLMFVYYFIYDLITSKKIKLRKTILSYGVTVVCLMIITTSLTALGDKLKDDRDYYYADEIVGLELRLSEIYYGDSWFGKIEDESLKRAIIEEVLDSKDYNNYNSSYYTSSYDSVRKTRSVEIRCKFNGGKEIELYGNITNDLYKRVLDYVVNDETYINDLLEEFEITENSMIRVLDSGVNVTLISKKYDNLIENINSNLKSVILNNIKDKLKNVDYNNYNKTYDRLTNVRFYKYDNFKRTEYSLAFDHETEFAENIYKVINSKALELTEERIKEIEKNEIEYTPNYDYYTTSGRIIYSDVDDEEKIVSIQKLNLKELKKYLEEFDPNSIDVTKPFVQITLYELDSAIFINDIEDLKSKVSFSIREEKNYNYFDDVVYTKEMEPDVIIEPNSI